MRYRRWLQPLAFDHPAHQIALRGVALISAVTFMAEIADVRRFETLAELMAYLGLVPS
ncbi:transposase [Chachezhania sediminis]|uniref:transposase n=1 Tax=Chachezhania sediminis TaxID=2599291 RepID=UPI0038994CF8